VAFGSLLRCHERWYLGTHQSPVCCPAQVRLCTSRRSLLCSLAPCAPASVCGQDHRRAQPYYPRGLLAQLMELTTYCSDCAPAHPPCSAIYALHLSHHVLSLHGARVVLSSRLSPSLVVAFLLFLLSFLAFAQPSNKRLSLYTLSHAGRPRLPGHRPFGCLRS